MTCVVCGKTIPEGRQVCPKCEQPLIVRCRNCKHYRINTVYPGTNMIMTYCAKTGIAENTPDWFCADGVRLDGSD